MAKHDLRAGLPAINVAIGDTVIVNCANCIKQDNKGVEIELEVKETYTCDKGCHTYYVAFGNCLACTKENQAILQFFPARQLEEEIAKMIEVRKAIAKHLAN